MLNEASKEEHLSLEEKTALGRELFNAFRKLDLLQDFLEDEDITEIMINGTDYIFYEKEGRLYQSDRRFVSKEKLEDVIQQIVSGPTGWSTKRPLSWMQDFPTGPVSMSCWRRWRSMDPS